MKLSKSQISWLLYDPASSAYAMIVRTVVTPLVLSSCAAGIYSESEVTTFWSLTASASGIAAGIISVLAGPYVDAGKRKVRMVGCCTILGVLSCLAYLVPPCFGGRLTVPMILAVSFCGICSFMAANSFYDSLLISIAAPSERDRLSASGYALGYAGALVSFLICLLLLKFAGEKVFVAGSFLLTAVWWMGGAVPLLCNVRETSTAEAVKAVNLRATFSLVLRHKNILLFLIAYFLYIDGVGTILMAATPLASGLKISAEKIMMTILALQIFGLPFTMLYGRLAKRFSAKSMVSAAIAVYVVIAMLVTAMSFCDDLRIRQLLFYLAAALIGTSQGGIQSLSRSIFSKIIPPERAAELFAVYNIFGKFTTIVGPVLITAATVLWNRAEIGITMLLLPFTLGAWLLSKVEVPEN